MDPAVITGIFSLSGTALGAGLGYGLTTLTQRSAARRAARQKAQDLFAQVVRAIGTVEMEKAAFRERRDSWRPNALAAGGVLLELLAARAAGNWASGAAGGVSRMIEWDSAEGARFIDRYQAAMAQITPALVQLSLMSPGLQAAAAKAGDAIGAAAVARKPRDRETAGKQVTAAVGELRGEVAAFAGRKEQRRGKTARRDQPPTLTDGR